MKQNYSSILPFDGEARYWPDLFTQDESALYFARIMKEIDWQADRIIMFGKEIITKRLTAWHGDEPYDYVYSKSHRLAKEWSPTLSAIKNQVEKETGESFNSCLLNLYPEGDIGMGWHSDDEKSMKKHGSIASISFGAERRFCFKHKEKEEKREILLENGSLLLMMGESQEYWLHSLPKTKKVKEARINLTFRTFVSE